MQVRVVSDEMTSLSLHLWIQGEQCISPTHSCGYVGSLVTEDGDHNIKAILCGLLIQGRILQPIRVKTADQQFELHFALKAKIALPIYKWSSSRTCVDMPPHKKIHTELCLKARPHTHTLLHYLLQPPALFQVWLSEWFMEFNDFGEEGLKLLIVTQQSCCLLTLQAVNRPSSYTYFSHLSCSSIQWPVAPGWTSSQEAKWHFHNLQFAAANSQVGVFRPKAASAQSQMCELMFCVSTNTHSSGGCKHQQQGPLLWSVIFPLVVCPSWVHCFSRNACTSLRSFFKSVSCLETGMVRFFKHPFLILLIQLFFFGRCCLQHENPVCFFLSPWSQED